MLIPLNLEGLNVVPTFLAYSVLVGLLFATLRSGPDDPENQS